MIIISEVSFPTQSAREICKVLMRLESAPDYITIEGPYIISTIEGGIKAITIYKYDKSCEEEAMKFVYYKRMYPFFSVDGFKFTVNFYLDTMEGLHLLGFI